MTKARVRTAVVATAAFALLTAGCSGDSPEPEAPGLSVPVTVGDAAATNPPDPCALVTLDEVSAALGETWSYVEELPATVTVDGILRTCLYIAQVDAIGSIGIGTAIVDPARIDDYRVASIVGDMEEADPTDVPGLGDAAWHVGSAIWVIQGSVMISLFATGPEVALDTLITLAEAALARLP